MAFPEGADPAQLYSLWPGTYRQCGHSVSTSHAAGGRLPRRAHELGTRHGTISLPFLCANNGPVDGHMLVQVRQYNFISFTIENMT